MITLELEIEVEERDSFAQATAWLAPFPPDPIAKDCAESVSPPVGTRWTVETRSIFREPIIVITGREDMLMVEIYELQRDEVSVGSNMEKDIEALTFINN
jgi:hypothetical protein